MNSFSFFFSVYNGEKTIKKCIDSVLNQKYDNFEIIVVNDGSKDDSKKILEKNYSENKNVKIINKDNSGVSDARNIGIKNSSKDWLLFLDCDDSIESDALISLDSMINNYNPDYIITPLIYFNKRNNIDDNIIINNKIPYIDNIVCLEYSEKKYGDKYNGCRCIGGKLIRKRVVDNNKIIFPSGIRKFEDGIFNLYAMHYSDKILYSSYQFYNYFSDNPESRTNNVNETELEEDKEVFYIVSSFLDKNKYKTDSIDYLAFFMFILSVDSIMHLCISKKEKKEKIQNIKEYYKDYFKGIKYKYLSLKKKIEFFLTRLNNVSLLYFLYNIKIKLLKK